MTEFRSMGEYSEPGVLKAIKKENYTPKAKTKDFLDKGKM